MDANGLRFWMLADQEQWQIQGDPPQLQYDRQRRSLRLASRRLLPPLADADTPEAAAAAVSRLEAVPQTMDSWNTRAYYDASAGAIMATGALPGSVPILVTPPNVPVTDLAMGYDGVLYLAQDGQVIMLDRRNRWKPVTLSVAGFAAWRLAADPGGGTWVLDRTHAVLARLQGLPLPDRPYGPYSANTVRPCEENPDPPRLTLLNATAQFAGEQPVAIACSPQGQLAFLTWVTGADARLRLLKSDATFGAPITLNGARRPYSLTWVSDDEVAVLVTGLPDEAPVYLVTDEASNTDPVGDLYPLRDYSGEPFVHGVSLPPFYATTTGVSPLHHLSLPSFAASGVAVNPLGLDSGSAQTAWHRLYIEADIPPHCGVTLYLAASDEDAAPSDPREWHPHRIGDLFALEDTLPRGAWLSVPSEVPFHPGLLMCDPVPKRAGLFTVLIQRYDRRVRTLRGRYLWVRVELVGDGRATPEVAAVRAYAARFSYLERYLPELYHETLFNPDADAPLTAEQPNSTPADFLERFLDNLEGILTPIEDRIADACLLTDPRTTNEEALEWLGSWIGVSFDPAYPVQRQRQLIEAAPTLFSQRGTLPGLALALDVVTGGAVSTGKIVIVEDYRLRRAFATILGADLADEQDPLLAGIAVSGNSYVGDTLFLGEETHKEFLALFAADLPKTAEEQAAVEALYDQLAYRVSVLVHQEVEPQDLGLIAHVVELETPAHVLAKVLTASDPFMVGIAALVGVDTYLSPSRKPEPVRLEQSYIGLRDLIQHPPSLDPRLEGGAYEGPQRP